MRIPPGSITFPRISHGPTPCSLRRAWRRTARADDRLATPEDAKKLCDAAGSESKTVKLFTPEEGGAEHCHVDNRQVGVDYVADWLSETFQR